MLGNRKQQKIFKGGNKMLKDYTFKVVLLDTNDEVKLSRIFCAETAR